MPPRIKWLDLASNVRAWKELPNLVFGIVVGSRFEPEMAIA